MKTPESRPHVSWLPLYTLFKKEVLRFLKVASQTLLAPLITASLYLLIFGVTLGKKIPPLDGGFSYLQFVIPGLILMGVINNSFANVSSSLFASRYMGNIADLLVTPLTPTQFQLAYTGAAMVRGLLVGSIIYGVSCVFTTLPWVHPLAAWSILLLSSFLFAQFGILASIISTNFDTLSMFTNFLILPLIYLGGLFYPVHELPPFWYRLSLINPIYYLIEGLRASLLGTQSLALSTSLTIVGGFALVLLIWVNLLIRSGYKLRS